jgi:mannosidase alpha-like ER degradation enhancer 2
MFKESREAIEQFLNHDDWHFWVTMKQGSVTMPVFQSLEAFWPGILSLVGDNIGGLRSIHNYHQVNAARKSRKMYHKCILNVS